jgi:AICAR transformylase/IMP cyclohydrolase PurH
MPSGTAVVAGFQEHGRGRAPGRRWLSPGWESLLMTVLLRAEELDFAASQLPLRAGLAVSRAVGEATGSVPEIRWPNDAMLAGRKVAGLLCEARGGLRGSVMISDGFFPFRDGVDVGIREGVTAVCQPGGSLKDYEVIEACNEAKPPVAIVFTGQRAFKH